MGLQNIPAPPAAMADGQGGATVASVNMAIGSLRTSIQQLMVNSISCSQCSGPNIGWMQSSNCIIILSYFTSANHIYFMKCMLHDFKPFSIHHIPILDFLNLYYFKLWIWYFILQNNVFSKLIHIGIKCTSNMFVSFKWRIHLNNGLI